MNLAGLSGAARKRVEQVRAGAELSFLSACHEPAPVARPDGDGSYTLHSADGSAYGYRSRDHRLEAAALDFVLTVFAAIVDGVQTSLPATAVQSTVDRLWDELLTEAYRDKHPHHTSADVFRARADERRRQVGWWEAFQRVLHARLMEPSRPFGDQLRAAMAAVECTTAQLVEATKLTSRTIERHLAGEMTPRRPHVDAYEQYFADHHHPVQFDI